MCKIHQTNIDPRFSRFSEKRMQQMQAKFQKKGNTLESNIVGNNSSLGQIKNAIKTSNGDRSNNIISLNTS